VWGRTVNLAARMEATGMPSVIQCSEGVYSKVVRNPLNTFTFDKPHNTFAKGFGNVTAYYVRSSVENPPRELLNILCLEPDLGEYFFDLGTGTQASKATARFGGIHTSPSIVEAPLESSDTGSIPEMMLSPMMTTTDPQMSYRSSDMSSSRAETSRETSTKTTGRKAHA
jgi:hypothetical protein